MALVSGGRSSLNPNAPLFIPAAVRQVEDFSPEWWSLVNTSTWFHDYWLSHQQGDDDLFDVIDMLPDSIDLGVDEDILNMEAQFEEFLRSTETDYATKPAAAATKGVMEHGHINKNVDALVKSLNRPNPRSPIEPMRYWEMPAKHVSPKCSPRFIQQPR